MKIKLIDLDSPINDGCKLTQANLGQMVAKFHKNKEAGYLPPLSIGTAFGLQHDRCIGYIKDLWLEDSILWAEVDLFFCAELHNSESLDRVSLMPPSMAPHLVKQE